MFGLVFLTVLLSQFSQLLSLKCFNCQGIDCRKGFCYGTYCILSTFKPHNGLPIVLKGCISGSMLKQNIQDQCESFDETLETAVGTKRGKLKTCFCVSNFCNGQLDQSQVLQDRIKLLNCHCDHCGRSRHCQGEFCTIDTNKKTGDSSRGCMNTTAAPIVSRGAINSCSRPGVTESMKIFKAFHPADFLDTENCLCNEFQFCNFKMPPDLNEERIDCPLQLEVEKNGRRLRLGKEATCKGEYCFDMTMNNTGSTAHDLTYLMLRGCTTRRRLYLVEELHAEGCIEFLTGGMSISICYKTPEDMKKSGGSTGKPGNYSPMNTVIVICFLFLIFLILLAGGVLKTDLLKRFLSTKYQSVS